MSFQAYLDNIQEKTGKTPEDFMKQLKNEKQLTANMKATDLINWLAKNYNLGRGHSMAIWKVFTSKGWVTSPSKKRK